MKRRVRQNIWGNWCGYEGVRKTQEFGTNEVAAHYWLAHGVVDFDAGYENPSRYHAAYFAQSKADQ